MAFLIALLISLNPVRLSERHGSMFTVWNVGQGLWTTWSDDQRCLHFDAGGEFINAGAVRELCHDKENFLYVSHWDMDHIRFVLKLKHLVTRLCLAVGPEGHSTYKKEQMFAQIPACTETQPEVEQLQTSGLENLAATEIFESTGRKPKKKKSRSAKPNTNDLSHVFEVEKSILIPGDSPAKMEKLWAREVHNPPSLLVLSHHGSRTATSDYFLDHVHSEILAIASSRKAKYGHPHAETLQRLRDHHIPVLTTEDWGTIQKGD